MLLKRKAQSTAEYAILIGLVIGVLSVMQIYVKRGMQGRMKDGAEAFFDAVSEQNLPAGALAQWDTITSEGAGAAGPVKVIAQRQWDFDMQQAHQTRQVLEGSETETFASGGTVDRVSTDRTTQANDDFTEHSYNRGYDENVSDPTP